MCSRCGQPIFPGISDKWERRIGATFYWLTSPIWGALYVAVLICLLPLMLIAAAFRYGADR
jgi:hypothetical protein